MEKYLDLVKKPVILGPIAFVIGLLIGWIVIGWGIWPVSWTDAAPKDLRADLRADYLRMVIDSYNINKDATLAVQRYQGMGDAGPAALQDITANPGNTSPASLLAFTAILGAGGVPVPQVTPAAGTPVPGATALATPTPVGAKPSGGLSYLPVLLGVLCVLVLIIGGALAYILFIRGKGKGNLQTPAGQAQEATRQAARTDYTGEGQETPVAQFMTTYMVGDDLYDDSFSIDSPSGEFLGECGVGISETIGVGDPKKVTAFEVWLFDKNDIQTVTKVFMSAHAFDDPAIRQRLESKGEPVLCEPGTRILLETATLQLEARVVDMNYGQGALPPSSYFERLTLELAIWPKEKPAS